MNLPPDDFDERARAAGRALRQAPPPDGLRRIGAARRNRRVAQAGGALAVAVLGIGGIVAITRGGGDETIVTSEPTTPVPPTSPNSAPPVTVPTTAPAATPSTTPNSPPPTSPASTPEDPAEPTVWVGQKLAGWYADGEFVPYIDDRSLPAGLLGTPVELLDLASSASITATPTDVDCSSPYLEPAPDTWSVYAAAVAPVPSAPLELRLGGIETPDGYEPAQVRVAELPGENLSGDQQRLVLADGWNTDYQFPTWIALFDPVLGEYSVIEGDLDPSNALDIGRPVDAYVDVDLDGNWEIVFGVGDGWGIHELTTAESIVFGAAHPCPDPMFESPPAAPTASTGIEPLLGEWAFDPDATEVSAATLWIEFDGTYTYARYAGCQDAVVEDGGIVSVAFQSTPECVPADADPRLRLLEEAFSTGAQLRVDATSGQLQVGTDEGVALTKVVASAGLDLARGAAYGYYAGQYVASVDDLVASISEQLGEPSHDTGWFVTPPPERPGEPDCLADMTTRAIWWGDFVVWLWPDERLTGGTIWNWTLGAQPTDVNVFADTPYTPTPSGLTTVEGFGVGQPMSSVDDHYGARFDGWFGQGDVTQWAEARVPAPTPFLNLFGNYGWLTATDGALATISAQKSFC